MERGFKGVWISKEIWLNKELTLQEKVFLVEINSLDNENGCFASNAHFSEFFGISKGRCTQVLKSLEAKKMISITIERKGKVIVKRVVRILNTLVNKLNNPSEKTKQPYLGNDEGSNTNTNNTKERDSALDFLQSNSPSQLETFLMQNKKQIADYDKFVLDFEAVITLEGIPFETDKLFARLGQYARNWIKNNSKFKVIKNEDETNRMANRHLNAAI